MDLRGHGFESALSFQSSERGFDSCGSLWFAAAISLSIPLIAMA